MRIDPLWPVLGRTGNASFLLADPHVIVVVPDEGCTDDRATARESVILQHEYWKAQGSYGVAVVLIDRVGHQTRDARGVYQYDVDPALICGFGLVARSPFGRAVASVFLGLARPLVPTRMFVNLEAALTWGRTRTVESHAG